MKDGRSEATTTRDEWNEWKRMERMETNGNEWKRMENV